MCLDFSCFIGVQIYVSKDGIEINTLNNSKIYGIKCPFDVTTTDLIRGAHW